MLVSEKLRPRGDDGWSSMIVEGLEDKGIEWAEEDIAQRGEPHLRQEGDVMIIITVRLFSASVRYLLVCRVAL